MLFDTGRSGSILLSNMEKLGIEARDIDGVFISHPDFDHIGGLPDLLNENDGVTLWVPRSFPGCPAAREVVRIEGPRELYKGIHSTGEIDGIEQSLCIETQRGIVIIAGCSHPRMAHIIREASRFGRPYGIVGGLHGNRPESLKVFDLICATHCTLYKNEIASLYPEQYCEGGVGKVIVL